MTRPKDVLLCSGRSSSSSHRALLLATTVMMTALRSTTVRQGCQAWFESRWYTIVIVDFVGNGLRIAEEVATRAQHVRPEMPALRPDIRPDLRVYTELEAKSGSSEPFDACGRPQIVSAEPDLFLSSPHTCLVDAELSQQP
jgi:hypothetical protein